MISAAHFWYLSIVTLGSALGGIGWLVRRYRHSAARELQSFAGYVWGTLRLSVGRLFSQALARQFGIRQYANRSLAAFPSHLPVPSIHGDRLEIDRAYIRLSLSATPTTRVQDGAILGPGMGSVLVFGEPGSGKSSLTKKLFREVCKQAYVSPFHSRMPVHLELGQAQWETIPSDARAAGDWLMELLRARAQVKGVHDPRFLFDAFAKGSGVVVLMDGLDEVPLAIIPRAANAILKVADDLRQFSSSTVIVVTGRIQLRSHLARSFIDAFNNVYTIEPFSPADVFAFLRRWPFDGSISNTTEAQRIFVRLKANPTLFDMCTNPLVLAMYVAHDQRYAKISAVNRLPDNRSDFYQEILNELLLYRRQEQSKTVQVAGSQQRKSRQHLLGAIALDHLLNSDDPANSISLRRATSITRRHLRLKTDEQATRALFQLGLETGIFGEERPAESIRFMHLTLCEFLAAMELSEHDDATFAETLDRTAGRSRLAETIVFAIALAGRKRRRTALERLSDNSVTTTLLLHAIREAQAYDVPVFSPTLDRATELLSRVPPKLWNAEWFTDVRLVLSCLSDAERLSNANASMSYPSGTQWLRKMVNNDVVRLDKVLDLYLAANPAEALQVAQEYGLLDRLFDGDRIVAALEQPDFVAFSVDTIQRGRPLNVEWINHLAEAALRHELVAQMLADEIPSSAVRDHANLAALRHSWHKSGPAAGTFYGAVLAIATNHPRWSTPTAARKLKRVELIAQIDARSSRLQPDYILTTKGALQHRRSLLRAAVGLEANRGDEWTLTAVTFLDISPTMFGMLVPWACREWAEHSIFSLTGRGLGRHWMTFAIDSKVVRGIQAPKAIRTHFARSPLAQVCAVMPFVDQLFWVPSHRTIR